MCKFTDNMEKSEVFLKKCAIYSKRQTGGREGTTRMVIEQAYSRTSFRVCEKKIVQVESSRSCHLDESDWEMTCHRSDWRCVPGGERALITTKVKSGTLSEKGDSSRHYMLLHLDIFPGLNEFSMAYVRPS